MGSTKLAWKVGSWDPLWRKGGHRIPIPNHALDPRPWKIISEVSYQGWFFSVSKTAIFGCDSIGTRLLGSFLLSPRFSWIVEATLCACSDEWLSHPRMEHMGKFQAIQRYRLQNYWWYRMPSVLVVPSIHIYRIYCIPFCMCAGLYMRSQIRHNTYMGLLMHLGKYIRILLTCCESMWNLFPYIVTKIFSTQAASNHPTSHKYTLNLYRSWYYFRGFVDTGRIHYLFVCWILF